jgi:DNA-binding LytR/AlgR family response regulator
MINCILIDDDNFVRNFIELFISKIGSLRLLHSLSNAVDAMTVLQSKEQIDLIFLDIELPGMSGIDFLNATAVLPQIIIISSKEKYAINAFDYDITDYLLKPFTFARFSKAVEKVQDKINQQKQNTTGDEIFIKHNSSMIRLKYADIVWIEALENYVVVNTISEKYTLHSTMKALEEKLPVDKFIRAHRSFIVNIKYIDCIEDNSLVMRINSNVNNIAIGKCYKSRLLNSLNLFQH